MEDEDYEIGSYRKKVCNVCFSRDSRIGNEIVFCNECKVHFHKSCYGLSTTPSNSWMCRTCSMHILTECVLCPETYGAMKCTEPDRDWAHISCALWIPEVSFGSVKNMEPIIQISNIPRDRWLLPCNLCGKRTGACIQCSEENCWTMFHVTCAFEYGLIMKAVKEKGNDDAEIELLSICSYHSKTELKNKYSI